MTLANRGSKNPAPEKPVLPLSCWLFLLPDLRNSNVLLVGEWPVHMLPENQTDTNFFCPPTDSAISEHVVALSSERLNQFMADQQFHAVLFWLATPHPDVAGISTTLKTHNYQPKIVVFLDKSPGVQSKMKSWAVGKSRHRPSTIRRLPVRFKDGNICEVIPSESYSSIKNSHSLTERVKERLWSNRLTRITIPGLLITEGESPLAQPIYQALTNEVVHGITTEAYPEPVPSLKTMFILPGKAILLHDISAGRVTATATIVCANDKVYKRRSNENTTLLYIHEQLPQLRDSTPEPMLEGIFQGYHYFVQSQIQGVTMDTNHQNLKHCSDQAVNFLVELAEATTFVQNDLNRVEQYFTSLASIDDPDQLQLTSIRNELIAALKTSPPSLVLVHGDYKIENVIFNRKDYRLLGVIDWDLSRLQGMPLFDLFYLLTYNRLITENEFFYQFYHDLISGKLADWEYKHITRYAKRLKIPEDLITYYAVLFFLDYINNRSPYRTSNKQTKHSLDQLLLLTNNRLRELKKT